MSIQKALHGSETETRKLLEERKRIVYPRQGIIDYWMFLMAEMVHKSMICFSLNAVFVLTLKAAAEAAQGCLQS